MTNKEESIVFRFSIKPIGPARSETQLRKDIKEALNEAVDKCRKQTSIAVRAEAEPEGGFLGFGIEWIWLLKAFAGGAAGALGKELISYFAAALRKRNIIPGNELALEPSGSNPPPHPKRKRPGEQGKAKTKTKKP